MWFRRSIKANTINAIIQIPPQGKDSSPQEGSQNSSISAKKIKAVKICVFSLWVPIAALFFILAQIFQIQGIFRLDRDVAIGLLGPLVISAGFAQMTHFTLYQLRDSKDLAQIRSSIIWIATENIQVMVILLVYISLFFGLVNVYLNDPSIVFFSTEISLYITSIQYLIAGFFCANKLGVYT